MAKRPDSRDEASGSEPVIEPSGEPDAGDLTWGVGAVSSRLSVTASTLRTWERRYGVGPSFRTQGGHRRYTQSDIDRVELMHRLLSRGVSAKDAARVARSLAREELELALSEGNHESANATHAEDELLAAVVSGDQHKLSQWFAGVLRESAVASAWQDVLAPALQRMTAESASGTVPASAASAASELLVRELQALVALERLPETDRTHVLFARSLPSVEAIPLLVLEAALLQAGVATHAVGPELDGRAVAALAMHLRPDFLITWGHPPTPPLRRAMTELEGVTTVIRALPAWPKEMSLRFGFEGPMVSTDVSDAVEIILDRVT